MSYLNFDQLALETFELGKKLGQLHRMEQFSDDLLDQIDRDAFWKEDQLEIPNTIPSQTRAEFDSFPSSPGLLFKIEQGANTFCLRAMPSDDLNDDAVDVIEGNRQLRHQLRFDENATRDDISQQLLYFETPIRENAEVLVETLCNRRFPLRENQLCNISDPGHSWWLEENAQQLTVHFRAPSIEREKEYLELGPLGDSRMAISRFQRLAPNLQRMMPTLSIDHNDRCLNFKVNGSDLLTSLKKMFRDGDNVWNQDEEISTTLYLFLEELATTRRFWKFLSGKLLENQK
ncbi:MAG: hypothetical protein COW00_08480 [Bdellovibrio sp. CG12_big_fil_rev_8_21_14_0_65_39_13]|nr:MAG: hypothetical protein COW78_08550 [Bdellovibrio sp. CG22_combo_CG10-13_8_21_14_all_39_27]PIQ59660.1 MAG: hypothetical protein COW00_08480 [Bdellovibrio sp. CG12_big_fil_rev_8_21_14_0_65_39_13]PIR36307.1 MAG: hypothetical protein COV37_04900 [Bdellovibrio sp. CG11_big_fil_rev_8_21_14_0_20_39_38]PJB52594.1 MAG: hypothetical protein CO099_11825 [Bdellovibrio sp. CG_4_9_14_3_um_filter_39_7]